MLLSEISCNCFKPGFRLRFSLLSQRGLSHKLLIRINHNNRGLTLYTLMKIKLVGHTSDLVFIGLWSLTHLVNRYTVISWKSRLFALIVQTYFTKNHSLPNTQEVRAYDMNSE